MSLLTKLFGTKSERELKKNQPLVKAILAKDEEYSALTNEELRGKTDELRARLANGATIDDNDIIIEAFAAAREATWRALEKKPFEVQVVGGLVLHQGRIAEMKTGEGKTITAVMPAYLNALTGNPVHIVTVNDYLAKFQGEMMSKVFRMLGMTTGIVLREMTPSQRREAYASDITYATNNELGFDYLRDNMTLYKRDMVQRGHAFAIVDEVDSILVDEARTPLIISGRGDKSTDMYEKADRFVAGLRCTKVKELEDKQLQEDLDGDYVVDEKARSASLLPSGVEKAERAFGVDNLTDPENSELYHHINQAIRARGVMVRDVDYVVQNGQVIIVDEFTGRLMIGRRYNEGLHQAIEAKEGVKVESENKTVATITFQNYFRLYKRLSGMTGTAKTEEEEFQQIYRLDVIEIPTNLPMIRVDHHDVVYSKVSVKYNAVIDQVEECHKKGQPVLVGTVSIDKSELLSKMLTKRGIKHTVLNAKHHEKEAEIVAQAGKKGAVTIATNMAGRGTDIILGGNPEFMARAELRKKGYAEELIMEADGYGETDSEEILEIRREFNNLVEKYKEETREESKEVIAAGGLFIIGTERHESRRIDNQLRGRAGRQGDPGESRFFISLEDDLMRLFGGERVNAMMTSMGAEDMPIEHSFITSAIENAQKRIESRNFQVRKSVLQYDDVMNRMREIIYGQRLEVLSDADVSDHIKKMIQSTVEAEVNQAFGGEDHFENEIPARTLAAKLTFLLKPETREEIERDWESFGKETLLDRIRNEAEELYAKREAEIGSERMREVERVILLRNVDEKWMDHIDAMHELRRGIGMRAYGHVDPVNAYKTEGFEMFDAMVDDIRQDTVRNMYTFRLRSEEPKRQASVAVTTAFAGGGSGDKSQPKTPVRKAKKVGPNDPCPCGSGKKYKKCCYLKENTEEKA